MVESEKHDSRMTLGEHLEELRWRLMLGLIGPIVIACTLLVYGSPQIIAYISKPFLIRLISNGYYPTFYFQSAGAPFGIYLKVSLLGGLIVGLPWLVWQLWKFVSPGLFEKERKMVTSIIPGSIVLTIVGLTFMFKVMLPVMLWFLIGFANHYPMPSLEPSILEQKLAGPQMAEVDPTDGKTPQQLPLLEKDPAEPKEGQAWIKIPQRELRVWIGGQVWSNRLTRPQLMEALPDLGQYITMVMWLALAFAITFQLPLVMHVGAKVGMIHHEKLAGARKYVLMISFVVGALLTPADPFSQTALAVPIYVLFEFGLILVKRVERQQAQAAAKNE